MVYLLFVSLLWAFSFGLIKSQLTTLDANFVSFIRMSLAFIVFLPFLKFKGVKYKKELMLVGAVQFGLMYVAYIFSYRYLQAYQVALFTIFTPIYVTLLNDVFVHKFNALHLIVALISVIGTGIIVWQHSGDRILWEGFGLMQLSNLFFAFGQIYYRKLRGSQTHLTGEAGIFAWLYLGAVIITGFFTALSVQWKALQVTPGQWITLIYLGILASGLGFFLWNFGATRVNAGTLAVFNNLKIPVAILVALLIFGEQANWWRLLIGGTIVTGALWFNERLSKTVSEKRSR